MIRAQFLFIALVWPCLAPAQLPDVTATDTFALAVETYFQNKVAQSLPLFVTAVRQAPEDPDRHAWLAEVYRRQGEMEQAVTEARQALALDICHTFAHEVLAGVFNPQFSWWRDINRDSMLVHLQRAIDCSPRAVDAWMSWWAEGVQRSDSAMEHRALNALAEQGFITQPWRAHATWVLESMPARALLLVNGDMDTYPAVVMQATAGLRTDVAVVNLSLLNLTRYASAMATRYGLPLPPAAELDTTTYLSDRIVRFWRDLATAGTLGRPLAVAHTVDAGTMPDGPWHLSLEGPYWRVTQPSDATIDPARVDTALALATRLDWTGPVLSPLDRSPIRRAASIHPVGMVAFVLALYTDAQERQGDLSPIRQWLPRIERLQDQAQERSDYGRQTLENIRALLGREP